MNKELKDKWLANLRSGEFAQTTSTLVKRDPETKALSFCCLGVLCAVTGHEPKFPQSKLSYGEFHLSKQFFVQDEDRDCIRSDGELVSGDFGLGKQDIAKLIEMNDNAGLSFPQIAAWIEKNIHTTEDAPCA